MKDEKDSKTIDLLSTQAVKNRVGRPKLHESGAEKQRAYRERMRADGKRVVSKVVIDRRDPAPIKSDIILIPTIYRARS